MSLREMKDELHDKLWYAQQSWFQLRDASWTKYGLKMAGIRSTGDVNTLTRGIIFTGRTRGTYEGELKSFLVYAHQQAGVQHLSDITTAEARDYLDHCISKGWAAKTLKKLGCALAKFGALTGQTESFAALSRKYGERIRELTRAGVIAGPSRATPLPEVIERAIGILADWDARHLARTGQPRAYALAARLQVETAARSVSATERLTLASLKDGDRVELIAKGGKLQSIRISRELHQALRDHLATTGGPLAD